MKNSTVRCISWIFAISSWMVPLTLLMYQWFLFYRIQKIATQSEFNMWRMSVLVVDISLAGLLSMIAVLLGSIALARTPENEINHPTRRMLELLLMALPLLVCLFVVGMLLVH